jgi:nitrate/nitrite transporter NarK
MRQGGTRLLLKPCTEIDDGKHQQRHFWLEQQLHRSRFECLAHSLSRPAIGLVSDSIGMIAARWITASWLAIAAFTLVALVMSPQIMLMRLALFLER